MDVGSGKFDYATIFCDKCDYSCRRKEQIKIHKATKHEGFRFKCTKCELEYQTIRSLKEHTKAEHEGVRLECKECDFSAKTRNILRNHRIKHDKERRQFPCTQCTKIYKNKRGLSKHIKTKHDKIGIKCEKCQFVVLSEKRLKEHARKHERPIVKKPEKIKKVIACDKCEEKFPSTMSLALHVGAAHFSAHEKYPCHLCDFETNSKGKLRNHIIDHMHKIKMEIEVKKDFILHDDASDKTLSLSRF